MYFNEHPNNMVITKKQYKRAVAFEMDKELKREKRKQKLYDAVYKEGKKAKKAFLKEYDTDSLFVAACRCYEDSKRRLDSLCLNKPMRLINE